MTSAIIVAAGSGKRMGLETPKQFIKIENQSILGHTLHQFVKTELFDEIIIVLSKDYFHEGIALQKSFPNQKIILCEGGDERFHSVQNALVMVDNRCDHVFIHDAVRPFFSTDLLQKSLAASRKYGCAIPAVALKDSIRKIDEEKSISVSRALFRSTQTPQVFDFKKLQTAYRQKYNLNFTDDASVFESAGYQINLIDGEVENIKITTPADLEYATFRIRKNLEG